MIEVSIFGVKEEPLAEKIKAIFREKYPDRDIVWEKKDYSLETKIISSDEDLKEVFERIIAEYPDLSVYGYYAYADREDDGTEWWGSTTIKSEKVDGVNKVLVSSSTNWN